MLKRFPVVVVAIVAMVALIAGGVVSAVDVVSPDLDPNENPDASLEVDPEENIGVDPEPGIEADPEADPEPGNDEDTGLAPEPGLDDEEDDEDVVNNIFALNIIQAYPELNLTEADVEALRQAGFGWGEISIACGIAVNSGESLDNIIALVSEGTGWGEIAESLGMEDRAFGQYVRGVIGKGHAYGRNEDKQSELDDAASQAVKEQVREQKNKDNKGNEGNKDNKNNKDKAKPSNAGKPDHAGIPGQGAKSADKDKGSSGK